MEGTGGLVGYCCSDLRYVIAKAGGENSPKEVEIPSAFRVKDVATLPPVHGNGVLVVEGKPGGQYLTVAIQQLGVSCHLFLPLPQPGRLLIRALPSPGRCRGVGPGKRPTGS